MLAVEMKTEEADHQQAAYVGDYPVHELWVKHLPTPGSKRGGVTLGLVKVGGEYYVGVAVCSDTDIYNHKTGAHLAMLRARKAAQYGYKWYGPEGRERVAQRAIRQHLPVKLLWG